ncbi:MAG: DegT/DnrJ/EryC1/StrS family aminotransferase [Planctomycetes bacterium]|nr:DegT/DnrJ/EryC1/StrS family aminotransferase [Planctomycetota bacterium]
MTVPFVDFQRMPAAQAEAIRDAVLRVLEHKRFILGAEVSAFENAAGQRLGDVHAVGVSSGTDALTMALMACGVERGDTVVTTPFSFFATVGVLLRLGARPHFVDIEPEHYGMNLAAADLRQCAAARALLPAHLFGACMELAPWQDALPQIPIIEDACQALDSRDQAGRLAGTIGRIGCFSFFPTKNLGAAGDAGLVTTRDAALAVRLRRMRAHGQAAPYEHVELGGNFRMDTIQAAVLLASLPFLDAAQAERRANAQRYAALFATAGLEGRLRLPLIDAGHSVHQYVVRIPERRDAVLQGLKRAAIGAAVYYPLPLSLQPCCAFLGHRPGDFPVAEQASREVLALPIAPGLREAEQVEVVQALAKLL